MCRWKCTQGRKTFVFQDSDVVELRIYVCMEGLQSGWLAGLLSWAFDEVLGQQQPFSSSIPIVECIWETKRRVSAFLCRACWRQSETCDLVRSYSSVADSDQSDAAQRWLASARHTPHEGLMSRRLTKRGTLLSIESANQSSYSLYW